MNLNHQQKIEIIEAYIYNCTGKTVKITPRLTMSEFMLIERAFTIAINNSTFK